MKCELCGKRMKFAGFIKTGGFLVGLILDT